LQLRESVHQGQLLAIKNMTTGEEATCTVRDVSAVPGGFIGIGLEFAEAFPFLAGGLSAAGLESAQSGNQALRLIRTRRAKAR